MWGGSMPKFSREMEDKIIALFEQGKRNSVISRELKIDRGTLPSRRKVWEKRKQEEEKTETEPEITIQHEQPLEPQKYTQAYTDELVLSESAKSRLKQLHTLLGSNSMEAMIESIYVDQLAAEKYRLEYVESMKEFFPGAEAPVTFAKIIAGEQGYSADLKDEVELFRDGYSEYRKTIAELKAEAERQYDEGYENGKKYHALLVPCVSCGMPITLTPGNEIHGLILDFLREHRIAHDDCIPRFKRIFA